MLDTKLISIDQHEQRQNGAIKQLQDESAEWKSYMILTSKIAKHWRLIAAIGVIGLYIFYSLLEVVSIPQIISFFIN